MIIGFDGSRAFQAKRTGTENYSYQLLYHLSQLDQTNNYYIYLRPGANVNQSDWPSNFHFITINYSRLWTQIGLGLQTLKDPLDLLFIPAHTLPLVRKPGLKTVLTVHDLGAEYLPELHQLKQRLYLKVMTDIQLKSATHLISVSNATKQDIIKRVGVNEKQISVVYEGVHTHLFDQPGDDKIRSILKQYDLINRNYFLFVGTIQPRKNLERVIKAFLSIAQKNPNTYLVLAGGKGWLSESIYTLPKQLGIEKQVQFLGYVPDQHLPTLYSQAIAFVFPSLFEGFGLPVLESFTLNCPVITSNTSSLPEVAGDAALLVNPYSVEEISKAMVAISDPALQKTLKQKGLQQVKKFSWQKAAEETLTIFKKISQ